MGSKLSFTKMAVDGYEEVVSIKCSKSGLDAIIAIHNTTLGPALGGVRALHYESQEEALNDVLRLSRGMTYKAAIAASCTGGGKSVILLPKDSELSDDMLRSFGDAVESFKGRYICAEDMGVDCRAIDIVHSTTDCVVGLEQISGDPSRFTAFGVFLAMKSVIAGLWGEQSFEGKTIAVQGLGAVGMKIAERIFWEGGNLIVSDVSEDKVRHAVKLFGAKAVSPEDILYVDCDILSPCARGGLFHEDNLRYLSCRSIVGAANNQLLEDGVGDLLSEAGIFYAPDYLVNAGGLINVAQEMQAAGYNAKIALSKLGIIREKLDLIIQTSLENKISTVKIANEIVEQVLTTVCEVK